MKTGELAVAREDCCSNIPTLRFERVDNLGAYRIPPETGILIPSGFDSYALLPLRSANFARPMFDVTAARKVGSKR